MPSGRATVFHTHVQWAGAYLKQADLVEGRPAGLSARRCTASGPRSYLAVMPGLACPARLWGPGRRRRRATRRGPDPGSSDHADLAFHSGPFVEHNPRHMWPSLFLPFRMRIPPLPRRSAAHIWRNLAHGCSAEQAEALAGGSKWGLPLRVSSAPTPIYDNHGCGPSLTTTAALSTAIDSRHAGQCRSSQTSWQAARMVSSRSFN